MYGAGLRVMECVRLRVKDIDFGYQQIIVRDGKGSKDRVTMLPTIISAPLKHHLEKVKIIHERDLKAGFGSVFLLRLNGNTKTQVTAGPGNMSFQLRNDILTPKVRLKGGIIFMNRLFSGQSNRTFEARA